MDTNSTIPEIPRQKTFPVLYQLVRTDLDSLNPGKGMAQTNHVGSAFTYEIMSRMIQGNINLGLKVLFEDWITAGPGFGTVITLTGEAGKNLTKVVNFYADLNIPTIHTGFINDPSYPVKDDRVTHLIPLMTCGWVFVNKLVGIDGVGSLPYLEGVDLHP